ncbi:hypothetical protein RRG08_022185 [Elysia crispata]|uniref:Uncharacterized protein n=1 Tax=Elysia crispata TaxID=231223 RepID=A0AAE1CZ21_9GAST|nr:hypothetical protein RRG08_022185 [Elysia crispata]
MSALRSAKNGCNFVIKGEEKAQLLNLHKMTQSPHVRSLPVGPIRKLPLYLPVRGCRLTSRQTERKHRRQP